jgi:actin-related protein
MPEPFSKALDHVVFSTLQMQGLFRATSPFFVSRIVVGSREAPTTLPPPAASPPLLTALVIDIGHSLCSVTPVVNGQVVTPRVKRIDVGLAALGRALASHIHYSGQASDFAEFFPALGLVTSHCQAAVPSLVAAFERVRRREPGTCDEFLVPSDPSLPLVPAPAPATNGSGSVGDRLALGYRAFGIPEALFDPRMLGLDEGGLIDACRQALEGLPPLVRAALVSRVVVVGGGARIPHCIRRLRVELAQLQEDVPVRVIALDMRAEEACLTGMVSWVQSAPIEVMRALVTRQLFSDLDSMISTLRFFL